MRDGLPEDQQLLDLPEAVSRLRVSARTIERFGQHGILTRVKVGARTRYLASEVESIIRNRTRPIRHGRSA
jgi:predicted DNA-binding transcriptional regulator AlpA